MTSKRLWVVVSVTVVVLGLSTWGARELYEKKLAHATCQLYAERLCFTSPTSYGGFAKCIKVFGREPKEDAVDIYNNPDAYTDRWLESFSEAYCREALRQLERQQAREK